MLANRCSRFLSPISETGQYRSALTTIFFEANDALEFEREAALGYRLNIAAGTATRFEPGQARTVELVSFGGTQSIYGFQGKVMGSVGQAILVTETDSREVEK